jgi:hypothetical protein
VARVRIEVPVEEKPSQATHDAEVQHIGHKPQKSIQLKKIIVIIAVLTLGVFVINLINERNQLQKELSGDSQNIEAIVKQLSKGVELPTDETPQMRTIEDASVFTKQNPSLADIRNGDQLLFFAKSQKVVVYRPSTKKAVVIVTLAQPTDTDQQNPTE